MKLKAVSLILSVILIAATFAAPVWAEEAAAPEAPVSEGVTVQNSEALDSAGAEEDGTISVTQKIVPCYVVTPDIALAISLYFVNGVEDLPYVDLTDWMNLMVTLMSLDIAGGAGTYRLEMEADDYLVQIFRENGYSMLVDFQAETISFDDYDAFVQILTNASLIDTVSDKYRDKEGNPVLIQRLKEGSYDRYGKELVLDLASYDIQLYRVPEENIYLVPLQTLGDFLLSLRLGASFVFNGDALFIGGASDFGTREKPGLLGELYYSAEAKAMSGELAWYNYCELCMMLDHLYGLKESHDIGSFDELFKDIGYRQDLTSTDSATVDLALNRFIEYYLDDLHSSFLLPSFRTQTEEEELELSLSHQKDRLVSGIYGMARSSNDEIPAYQEVGNTAYVTFDSFNTSEVEKYLDGTAEIPMDPSERGLDTIALILYAHNQISREDSPIENVVIDLSLNGGGELDAAVFAASWFLGETELCIRDSLTGAISVGTYRADTNLDGVFDEKDTVSDKNLYCLTSPYSFSCGNLLPNLFKSSHKVTLLGKTSGGGSCMVLPISTANGTLIQISAPYHLCYAKNGSFYDTDLGVEPDSEIIKPEHFYNREVLTEYINNLF